MTTATNDASIDCLHFLERFRLEDGGVVRAVLDLAAATARLGQRIVVATYDASDVPAEWPRIAGAGELSQALSPGMPVVFVPQGIQPGVRRQCTAVVGQMRQLIARTAVIHLHVVWAASTVQVAKLARIACVPVIVTPHGMLDDWSMAGGWLKKRVYYWLVLRGIMRSCARIHCTAEAERDQAAKWLVGTPVTVIPYVVDVSPFLSTPRPADHPTEPHVLFLSRLHPKKAPHHLIEAAAILARQNFPIRLTIAGPADDPAYAVQLRSLASASGIADHVSFPGLVKGDAKIRLYAEADLFALPTQQENFGIVLIEAMASGTPVLTTRGTDIWKEVQAGGAEVVANQPQFFADAIRRLISNREQLRQRGNQGRQWAAEVFGGDSIARRFAALYGETSDRYQVERANR